MRVLLHSLATKPHSRTCLVVWNSRTISISRSANSRVVVVVHDYCGERTMEVADANPTNALSTLRSDVPADLANLDGTKGTEKLTICH
jgi:hypothetical protein